MMFSQWQGMAVVMMAVLALTSPARVQAAGTGAASPWTATAAGESALPDFQTATVQQLSAAALQALGRFGSSAPASSPALAEKIAAVKTALTKNQATQALASLGALGEAAKGVPGADALLASIKPLVSAWALKQGFDVAKISGVLGALQKGDVGALSSQAATLLAKGALNESQQGLLNGVLGAYGIDANKAKGAAGALKGLFGK